MPPHPRIKLRKYRNRRYYDTTRSTHVTLEDIYVLVREGHDIEVTDSQTGEDITARVLTQIITEYDPLKLGVFPVQLLHQVIRANEPLVREFVEKYFNQALSAYLESQQRFDGYLRRSLGLDAPSPVSGDWMRMMSWPFAAAGAGPRAAEPKPADASEIAELRALVEQLRQQVESLRKPSDTPPPQRPA